MLRLRVLLCLFAAIFAATGLHAQVAGRLSGSVVDQSGAAIPGATVNVFVPGGKEPVLSATTNEAGFFSFIAVRPDTYDIAVESKGFTKSMMRLVKVSPIQETGLPPIKLEVQSATASVEVTADANAVQLSNAEISSTITATQVQNLPVLGRQVSTLFLTQAGVAGGSNTTSVNGLRSSFSNVTLDGINIQDNFSRTNDLDYAPMRTTIDQIAEITVSTSNAGTAIGGGASQMVLSTKSGSNQYHGAVYWFNRNSALSANDWFNNQSDIKRTFLDLNQAGASLSGHIIKDKLFFFVNPEFYRMSAAGQLLRTVLTDDARKGIITYRDNTGQTFRSRFQPAPVHYGPTIKAMIDQLLCRHPAPVRRRWYRGLPLNACQNESRDHPVGCAGITHRQTARNLQLHHRPVAPTREPSYGYASGEQFDSRPDGVELALDGFSHPDQRSARRFHALQHVLRR
jgi:hypothetical protein